MNKSTTLIAHPDSSASSSASNALSRMLGKLTSRRFRHLLLLPLLVTVNSCSNVDRGLMQVSDAISSRDPVTGAREINLMSERAEINQGVKASQQIIAKIRQQGLRYDNQLPEYGRVRNVFNRLRRVVHRQNLPWEVHLVGSKSWNAFTVGGGKVFLFQGLMQGDAAIRGDDELAVVLAHEMAHNTARHIGERQGKTLLTQLADKKTRNSLYQASWSSNQEHEADKFSVIYMALAGYDPMAAARVWTRMAQVKGSYSTNMLHSHPLNHERAAQLQRYAAQARQYYIPGQINPRAGQIAICNAIYCNRGGKQAEAGSGAGASALLETVANAYIETQQAKAEATRRQQIQGQQVQVAARSVRFRNIRMAKLKNGKPVATGVVENTSSRNIRGGVVRVQYLLNNKLVHQHSTKFPALRARQQQPFTIPLKTGSYDNIRLIPEYVQ